MRTLGRVFLFLWSLLLIAGFSLAYLLTPDPSGSGTHQQLGLPPCSFKLMLPEGCPSCGMTTSFSFFVRGQLIEAARANPGGLLLAMVCLVQIPWCWWSIFKGRLWKVRQPDLALIWLLVVFMVVSLGQWGLKIWLRSL